MEIVFVVVFMLSIVILLLRTTPVDSIELQKQYIKQLQNEIMSLEYSKSELEEALRAEYNAWEEFSTMIRDVGEKK